MSVRAKFTVGSITDFGKGSKQIAMMAVYDPSIPEDRRFCDATPWGEIKMTINNPAALEQLQIGKQFYADFTEVKPTGSDD